MFRPNQLVINLHLCVGRQGESDASVGICVGKNGGVDADDLAFHIDQWSTRIAGVNGSVGLNEGLELAAGNDTATFVENDARGHRRIQSEGTADGQDPVAHLHALGIT